MSWVILPLIGGLIGWVTNHWAIWMLFHPYEPIRIFGWMWQGVIPRRQAMLADKLARVLQDYLFTTEDQHKLMDEINFEEHLDRMVTQIVENEIPSSPFETFPAVERIRDKLVDAVRSVILRRMPKRFSELDASIRERLSSEIDVASHIRQRIQDFPMKEFEAVVRRVVHREFRAIEAAGAGIGFLIGLVQAAFLNGIQQYL